MDSFTSTSLFGGPDSTRTTSGESIWYKPSIMVNHNRYNLIAPSKLQHHFLSYESSRVMNLCYDCTVGHELRGCNGSSQLHFDFCRTHRHATVPNSDREDLYAREYGILQEVRDFWMRKHKIGPLGLKFIRSFPPRVTYFHSGGCSLSPCPEVIIGDTSTGPANCLFFKNCYGVFVNARGEVLNRGSEVDRELAVAHRWLLRRITVLQGFDEQCFTEKLWSDANRYREE